VLNLENVAIAVQGQDAVLSALGHKKFLLLGAKSSAATMFLKIAEERKMNFDIF